MISNRSLSVELLSPSKSSEEKKVNNNVILGLCGKDLQKHLKNISIHFLNSQLQPFVKPEKTSKYKEIFIQVNILNFKSTLS
jgi:hypothetical protein